MGVRDGSQGWKSGVEVRGGSPGWESGVGVRDESQSKEHYIQCTNSSSYEVGYLAWGGGVQPQKNKPKKWIPCRSEFFPLPYPPTTAAPSLSGSLSWSWCQGQPPHQSVQLAEPQLCMRSNSVKWSQLRSDSSIKHFFKSISESEKIIQAQQLGNLRKQTKRPKNYTV